MSKVVHTPPHIFKTTPHLVEKVWGGRKLEEIFGKSLPTDAPFGESWEIADLEEGQSLSGSGPLSGVRLRAFSKGWKRQLVGQRAPRADRFPLLVKLLDARRDLSVQVHPGPEDALRIKGASSKDEAWLILDSDEDGAIIHGLSQNGVSEDEFRMAVEGGVVGELLERVPVKKGDVIRVAPGTIHAICGGVVLLEIQEPSDTTYRVYDYERPGLDGKPRELHLEEALDVAWLGRSEQIILEAQPSGRGARVLVDAPSYRVEVLEVDSPCQLGWQIDPDSAQVLHVLEGRFVVDDGIGGKVEINAFESAVVPACMGAVRGEFRGSGAMVISGLAVEELTRSLRIESPAEVTS